MAFEGLFSGIGNQLASGAAEGAANLGSTGASAVGGVAGGISEGASALGGIGGGFSPWSAVGAGASALSGATAGGDTGYDLDTESEGSFGPNARAAVASSASALLPNLERGIAHASRKRDFRTAETIDAMYAEQERLNKAEAKRREKEVKKDQQRMKRLEEIRESYVDRSRDFMSRLQEEAENISRGKAAADRMKQRQMTAEDIRDIRIASKGR